MAKRKESKAVLAAEAADAVAILTSECGGLMELLAMSLDEYEFALEPATWPQVGDLEHVRNLLREAADFVGAVSQRLASHTMFGAEDLAYLRAKGYSVEEIAEFWDRDEAAADEGDGPCLHPLARFGRRTLANGALKCSAGAAVSASERRGLPPGASTK